MSNERNATDEAVFGIAPTMKKERTMGFWAMAAVTSIWSLAPWCFTQGGTVVSVLGLKAALANIIGVVVIFSIIYLLAVIIPARHGIDTFIYQRAVFGHKGMVVLWFIFMLSTWGWEAILTQIYGTSLESLYGIATGQTLSEAWIPWLGATCVIIGAAIALMGPKAITRVSYVVIPGVIIVAIVILWVVFSNYSWDELMALQATGGGGGEFYQNFMLATEWNLAFVCAWYGSMGVYPRLGKSERVSYWGYMVGFGFVYALITCVGAFGSLAISDMTGVVSSDPSVWFSEIGGPIAILCLILLVLSNISIMATAMYSLSVSTKVVRPQWRYNYVVIGWSIYVLILGFAGIVWDYYNVFLSVVGFIGGPAIIIMLVDYFSVRRQKFSLLGILRTDRPGPYSYTGGFNLLGVVAFICGAIAYFAIYDPLAGVGRVELFYLITGTGFSCIVAGLVYYIGSKIPAIKRYLLKDRKDAQNDGEIIKSEEELQMLDRARAAQEAAKSDSEAATVEPSVASAGDGA